MSFKVKIPSAGLLVSILVLAILLSACSPSVKVRSDVAPDVNMSQFQTYSFFSQLGVEDDGYSSLLGQHFRDAIFSEMDVRGFMIS